ncbi:hypothetical protein DSO57_1016502, partial [Entomophthora muscae]
MTTSQPVSDCPQDSVVSHEPAFIHIFGGMYITLTGLGGSMVPNSGPWSLIGFSLAYTIKLAPSLGWALLAGPATPITSALSCSWLPKRSLAAGWQKIKKGVKFSARGRDCLWGGFAELFLGLHQSQKGLRCADAVVHVAHPRMLVERLVE